MSAARIVDLFAVINGERDKLRPVWDQQATDKERRLLLAMAGATMAEANAWAGRAWCDLRPEVRGNIAGGLRRFKGWAERVAP